MDLYLIFKEKINDDQELFRQLKDKWIVNDTFVLEDSFELDFQKQQKEWTWIKAYWFSQYIYPILDNFDDEDPKKINFMKDLFSNQPVFQPLFEFVIKNGYLWPVPFLKDIKLLEEEISTLESDQQKAYQYFEEKWKIDGECTEGQDIEQRLVCLGSKTIQKMKDEIKRQETQLELETDEQKKTDLNAAIDTNTEKQLKTEFELQAMQKLFQTMKSLSHSLSAAKEYAEIKYKQAQLKALAGRPSNSRQLENLTEEEKKEFGKLEQDTTDSIAPLWNEKTKQWIFKKSQIPEDPEEKKGLVELEIFKKSTKNSARIYYAYLVDPPNVLSKSEIDRIKKEKKEQEEEIKDKEKALNSEIQNKNKEINQALLNNNDSLAEEQKKQKRTLLRELKKLETDKKNIIDKEKNIIQRDLDIRTLRNADEVEFITAQKNEIKKAKLEQKLESITDPNQKLKIKRQLESLSVTSTVGEGRNIEPRNISASQGNVMIAGLGGKGVTWKFDSTSLTAVQNDENFTKSLRENKLFAQFFKDYEEVMNDPDIKKKRQEDLEKEGLKPTLLDTPDETYDSNRTDLLIRIKEQKDYKPFYELFQQFKSSNDRRTLNEINKNMQEKRLLVPVTESLWDRFYNDVHPKHPNGSRIDYEKKIKPWTLAKKSIWKIASSLQSYDFYDTDPFDSLTPLPLNHYLVNQKKEAYFIARPENIEHDFYIITKIVLGKDLSKAKDAEEQDIVEEDWNYLKENTKLEPLKKFLKKIQFADYLTLLPDKKLSMEQNRAMERGVVLPASSQQPSSPQGTPRRAPPQPPPRRSRSSSPSGGEPPSSPQGTPRRALPQLPPGKGGPRSRPSSPSGSERPPSPERSQTDQ